MQTALLPGDLILVRGNTLASRIVEKVTNSRYSHVAIYIGEGLVMEAQAGRKVGFLRFSAYQDICDVYRLKTPLLPAQAVRMDMYLRTMVGGSYDYADIIVLLIRYLFRFKLPWHETKRFICSNLVYKAYRHAGIKLTDEENVSPEDLAESSLLEQVTSEGGHMIG